MTKQSIARDITDHNDPSFQDRIKHLEASTTTQRVEFCYLIASGMQETPAFTQSHGYPCSVKTQRILNDKTCRELISMLRQENNQQIKSLQMDKGKRLEHLLSTALVAHSRYIKTEKAHHGALYLKTMQIINEMTGDNAPTEVHHLVSVSSEQLESMSHSERTEAYRRMMSGKLKIINDGNTGSYSYSEDNSSPRLIEQAMSGGGCE